MITVQVCTPPLDRVTPASRGNFHAVDPVGSNGKVFFTVFSTVPCGAEANDLKKVAELSASRMLTQSVPSDSDPGAVTPNRAVEAAGELRIGSAGAEPGGACPDGDLVALGVEVAIGTRGREELAEGDLKSGPGDVHRTEQIPSGLDDPLRRARLPKSGGETTACFGKGGFAHRSA